MGTIKSGDAPSRSLSPWYVSGFVENAGSFTYSRGRDRAQLTMVFAIRVPASQSGLLESIRVFLGGGGRIYTSRPERGALRYFKATRPAELLRIVEHFDRYPLQGDRREHYRVWREMVLLKAAHLGARAPLELLRLAEKLSGRPASRRPADSSKS